MQYDFYLWHSYCVWKSESIVPTQGNLKKDLMIFFLRTILFRSKRKCCWYWCFKNTWIYWWFSSKKYAPSLIEISDRVSAMDWVSWHWIIPSWLFFFWNNFNFIFKNVELCFPFKKIFNEFFTFTFFLNLCIDYEKYVYMLCNKKILNIIYYFF